MKVGDKCTIGDQPFAVVWSSADMTDKEHYESHLRTAEFMEQYGLSAAFQRHMAEKYRAKYEKEHGTNA